MRDTFLPFSPPLIGDEEIAEVVDTLRSDWITTGPKVKKFEEDFAAFVKAPSALAVNSATAAMHVALCALGIGPGDAILTTPITFCSGVHVIHQVGAKPVLVDVEEGTLNLDPICLRKTLEQINGGKLKVGRPRAVMPVHLYGHPCDMDAILQVAEEYSLAVIQDAAHAIPAKYKENMIGCQIQSVSVPLLSAFSFYATKNLTTAEGGMLTGNLDLLAEARIWSLHGMNRDAWKRYGAHGSWHYDVDRPGFKYNMTDIQAAIGIQQLRKLSDLHGRRKEIARIYDREFSRIEELQIPTQHSYASHAWHIYAVRLRLEALRIDRNEFITELKSRNIGASVHFIPIHHHSFYRGGINAYPESLPVASREYERLVSLPLSPKMSDQDVRDVVSAVSEIIVQNRRRQKLVTFSSRDESQACSVGSANDSSHLARDHKQP